MDEKVCAVIVTYNRKELLRECLRAVLSQTRPPDHVLVVDNASTDGTPEMLREEFPQVEVLRLPENQGGAGGFHEGMKRAYEAGFDWLWIMDDDALPDGKVLEELLLYKHLSSVLVPLAVGSSGFEQSPGIWLMGYRPIRRKDKPFFAQTFPFVGPLIKREVIEEVGFPRKEFFIWADDLEWSLRASKKGFSALVVPWAKVQHDFGQGVRIVKLWRWQKVRPSPKPWKLYYGTRNVWVMLEHMPLGRRMLERLVFLWQGVVRPSLVDILFEPDWKQRLVFRAKGLKDGFYRRLGKLCDERF